MTHLLDTNVCIDVLRGRPEVLARLRQLPPDDCAVSSITLFELMSGAQKARDPVGESAKVKRFVETMVLQAFDETAAEHAAIIRSDLEQRGLKIGAYDTLLAGQALALNVICVTDNTNEFSRVSGLQVENWRI